jgi:hypothetical protein
MAKSKILKIAILDDELDDGIIYMNAYQNLVDFNQPKKENVRTFSKIIPFLDMAQTADFIFIDFGRVGNFTSGRLYDNYSQIFKFAEEHPSKIITFVLTMPWNYYKDYDIFQLLNVEYFDISDSGPQIANRVIRWLFDNVVHDLFTKDWLNLQEQEEYIPKLKKSDAMKIAGYLYDCSLLKTYWPINTYRCLIKDWYLRAHTARMKIRKNRGANSECT